MSQDLYAVISTYKASDGGLPKLLEAISAIPNTGEKFSTLSVLTDNETVRGIKIYDAPGMEPSSLSFPSPVSVNRFKYFAGFLPASPPPKPYILWANVHYKPILHPSEMLPATLDIVEKVREREPGTLCYLWLQDRDDERHVAVFEMYASVQDLRVHEGTEWYAEYGRMLFPGVDEPVFSEAVAVE